MLSEDLEASATLDVFGIQRIFVEPLGQDVGPCSSLNSKQPLKCRPWAVVSVSLLPQCVSAVLPSLLFLHTGREVSKCQLPRGQTSGLGLWDPGDNHVLLR